MIFFGRGKDTKHTIITLLNKHLGLENAFIVPSPTGVESQEPNNNYFPRDNNIPRINKATSLFFPPQRLCKITINKDVILDSFIAYISTLTGMEQIEFYQEENGFLKMRTTRYLTISPTKTQAHAALAQML